MSYPSPGVTQPVCLNAIKAQGIHEYLKFCTGKSNLCRAMVDVRGWYLEHLQFSFINTAHCVWIKEGLIITCQREQLGPFQFHFTTANCFWNKELRKLMQTRAPNQKKLLLILCLHFLLNFCHVRWVMNCWRCQTRPAQWGRWGRCRFVCLCLDYTKVEWTESHRQADEAGGTAQDVACDTRFPLGKVPKI